jgi:hypothetical protein
MPRDFTAVQREIQEWATRLGELDDPKDRRAILAELRLLLKEAQSIVRRNAA